MGLVVGAPPAIQDLKLIVKVTGAGAATLSATIPSGYRYLHVVFYGVTAGDPGATPILFRINGVATNYLARTLQTFVATLQNVTNTTGVPVQVGSAFGAAACIGCVLDVMCPASRKKMIVGASFGTEEGTETTSSQQTIVGESDDTAEVTSVSFVLAASTWTTATELRVYGADV